MFSFLKKIREDLAAIRERDPAARSTLEVITLYSGLHAIWIHRLTHWLWMHRARLLARALSQLGRLLTGIEIHPAAQIGKGLFIDHGMGVVIGETTVIGEDVTLYQGVTLGGTGKERGKRHPTLGNNVMVGAGAKILGNINIGDNSRIGAGSVVLRDVPSDSTIVGVPGHVVLKDGKRAVITDPKQINDPLSDALSVVAAHVRELERRLVKLEGRQDREASEEQPQSLDDSLERVIELDYQI